jgi:hypothetical protein
MSFHRLKSTTQTYTDSQQQLKSGKIWGKAPSWGGEPSVKAYRGALPVSDQGIEFTTTTSPTAGTGTPTIAYWRKGTHGVSISFVNGVEFAVISATVTKVTQVP